MSSITGKFRYKRVMSLLLALVMLFSVVGGITASVSADGLVSVNVTLSDAGPTGVLIQLEPAVAGLLKDNFAISGNITVDAAETADNGATYALTTSLRNDNDTHTLTVSGADGYVFNEIPMVSHNIIPKPVSYVGGSDKFVIGSAAKFVVDVNEENRAAATDVAEYLAAMLRAVSGYDINVVSAADADAGDVLLKIIPAAEYLAEGINFETTGVEGYALNIGETGVQITAYTTEGLFRGVTTLRQMLPAEIEKGALVQDVEWAVTYASIYDYPRYEFRSIMLDSGRHFRSVEETKRQIDIMAQYKISVLHMHLTDNEGFRIAFDRYPELTDFAGETKNFGSHSLPVPGSTNRAYPGSLTDGYSGYYTQQDYKDIVAFAQSRYVQIVPEIEFPGHILSQLVSIPELTGAANGGAMAPYRGGLQGNGSGRNLFMNDPNKNPFTAKYVDDIMKQLAALTPSKYIHMGGDEVYSMSVPDYTDASGYILDSIGRAGKLSIQWVQDNAGANNYPAPDVIQNWKNSYDSWSFVGPAVEAGSMIIANLSDHTYFDHPMDLTMPLGQSWGMDSSGTTRSITTPFAYQWEPEQAAMRRIGNGADSTWESTGYEDRIIGVEACLWSEMVGSETAVDIMLYPRTQGLAEIGWSPKEDRGAVYPHSNPAAANADLNQPAWVNHRERLKAHGIRMSYQGIDYMNDTFVWESKKAEIPTKRFDVTTKIDTPVSGNIVVSAEDAGDTVTVKKASNPSQGTLNLTADGSWTYTPNPGFVGADSFWVSFPFEGFGIPMGTESMPAYSDGISGRAGTNGRTDDYNGFAKVYITVEPEADVTYNVDVKVKAVSKDNMTVSLNPPVPGMRATITQGNSVNENFIIDGVNVKYAETYDNGSTYVLVTEQRVDDKEYTIQLEKPGYSFNPVSFVNKSEFYVDFEKADGKLNAAFDVRSYKDTDVNVRLAFAVYGEKMRLENLVFKDVTIPMNTFWYGETMSLDLEAGQMARAFIWDADTFAPLCSTFNFAG